MVSGSEQRARQQRARQQRQQAAAAVLVCLVFKAAAGVGARLLPLPLPLPLSPRIGRIERVRMDGTFDIAYGDGDCEEKVPQTRVRSFSNIVVCTEFSRCTASGLVSSIWQSAFFVSIELPLTTIESNRTQTEITQ